MILGYVFYISRIVAKVTVSVQLLVVTIDSTLNFNQHVQGSYGLESHGEKYQNLGRSGKSRKVRESQRICF